MSIASIHEVLDQVRNRILNFALELESLNPKAGEPVTSVQPVLKDHMRNIFNTVIKGDVHNLAQASESFSQQANVQQNIKGDFEALRNSLTRAGLAEDDVQSLSKAISADKRRGKETMGEKVKGWLGDVLLKVSDAGVSAASNVTASVVTGALKGYFGLQ